MFFKAIGEGDSVNLYDALEFPVVTSKGSKETSVLGKQKKEILSI